MYDEQFEDMADAAASVCPRFDVILPAKDTAGRIVGWEKVGTIKAFSTRAALGLAREEYGSEADVRMEK